MMTEIEIIKYCNDPPEKAKSSKSPEATKPQLTYYVIMT